MRKHPFKLSCFILSRLVSWLELRLDLHYCLMSLFQGMHPLCRISNIKWFSKLGDNIFLFDRPITGASMNPVRSLGPAFMHSEYRGIWIYLISPVLGAVAGAWVYNLVRYTNKPLREIVKSASFLKEAKRGEAK